MSKTPRTYGQLCPAARALDLVGQRWTLLIVRNLLVSPMRYGELLASCPGLTTNLLAERLRELEAAGILSRQGPDYALTPRGAALRPTLYALAEWGMAEPLPEGAVGALRPALLSLARTRRPTFAGALRLEVEGHRTLFIEVAPGVLSTALLPTHAVDGAWVTTEAALLAVLFRGARPELEVEDVARRAAWEEVLRPPGAGGASRASA